MTLRSQALAALAVLFVTLGVVFVATDSIGVNTGVFLPDQPTPTPELPTPTPLPVASADNWVAVGPGQYQYSGDIQATAEITVLEGGYDDFLLSSGLELPAEDAPYPLMDLLAQVREDINGEVESMALVTTPDDITGPIIEMFGGVPVTTLQFELTPQLTASGLDFPGIDLVYAWFMRGEDELVRIGLYYEAGPDATMQADFRAWLNETVPELAQVEEDADADADVDADAEPDADADVDADADADVDTDADAEPDADVDADAEPDVDAEPDADTTDVDAGTEPEAEADADADAEVTTADELGTWVELQEGVYLHSVETNAQIQTMRDTLDNLAAQVGYEAEDAVTPEGLLTFVAETNQAQIEEMGEAIDVISFEGPETMDVNGVTVTYIRFVLSSLTEDMTVGQETFLGLVTIDENTVTTVSFQYGYETEANPTVNDDFQQWLEENIDTLSAAE